MATDKLLKDQLTALNKIVKNTGAAAKTIASERQTGNFTGGGNDKLEKSSKGLLEGFKDLITHSDRLREAQEKLTKSNEDYLANNKETVNSIESLSKAYELQRASSQSVSMANKNLKGFVDILGKDLVQHGYGVNDLGKEIGKAGGDFKKIQKVLDGFSDSLKESIKVNEANVKNIEGEEGIMSSFFSKGPSILGILKAVAAVGATIAVQWSNLALRSQELGLQLGGLEGTLKLGELAAGMGASLGDTQRFIAGNREIITTLTNQATVTATEGLRAIDDYGDVVRDTFGAIGVDQLELVGKGMQAITNFGQQISPEAFGKFNQGIEDMAKTSNLSAKELFSEFADLSEMEGMQSLMLTLGEGADVSSLLFESFLTLQKTVGMSATEFIKHRRRLAEDTKRSGDERIVQGEFIKRLARSVGGFTEEQIQLMATTKSFRESLTEEQRIEGDVLIEKLAMSTSELQNQAAHDQKAGALIFLRTMTEGANIQDKQALLAKKRAKITDALAAAQPKALEESRKGTDLVTKTNAQIQEFIQGLLKGGPLSAAGITAAMTGFTEGAGDQNQVKALWDQVTKELLPHMGELALKVTDDMTELAADVAQDATESIRITFNEQVSGLGQISKTAGEMVSEFVESLILGKKDIDTKINTEFSPTTPEQTLKFALSLKAAIKELEEQIAKNEDGKMLSEDEVKHRDEEVLKMMARQNELSTRLNELYEEADRKKARETAPILGVTSDESTGNSSAADQ